MSRLEALKARIVAYADGIKNAPGYQLLPSETNPNVRRWQSVMDERKELLERAAQLTTKIEGDNQHIRDLLARDTFALPMALTTDPQTAAHHACMDCSKCSADAPCGLGSIEFPPIPSEHRREFAQRIFDYFGHRTPGEVTDLRLYDLPFTADNAHDVAKQHGFQVKFFGNHFGPPNFKDFNYKTGYLMVYDPTQAEASFKDPEYTEKWRIMHELGHALTEPHLDERWGGTGRRAGGLGKGLSLRDAMRAIDWEDLAVTRQHVLYNQHFNFRPPLPLFNQEMNITLSDAVYRVFTGDFSDPDLEGFHPSPRHIPTKRAIELADALGNSLGLSEDIGANPYNLPEKRSYSATVTDGDDYVGWGAGLGYSWDTPHYSSRNRLGE